VAILLAVGALAVLAVVALGRSGHPRGPTTPTAGSTGDGASVAPGSSRPRAVTSGPSQTAAVRRLAALGLPLYCAGRRGDMVALTFDDGPGPYTNLAIRKLERHGARATFFLVGRNLGLVPGAVRRERKLGAVGDHTWTHPLLTQLTPASAESEIVRTQIAVAQDSGAPVDLFRPPYGGRNQAVDQIARRHGMLEVLWTVDSADSLGADYAGIARNVIAGLHGGSIILMHENRGQTIRALLQILPEIERRHLHAVSVPELLAKDPPSVAQLRAGPMGCGTRASAGRGGS